MAKLRLLVPEATRNYVKNPSARFDLTGWVSKGVTFILLDEFTAPVPAPLPSPRNCDPGPNQMNFIDTGNLLSISGGNLVSAGVTVSASDPRVYAGPISRQNGIAFYWEIDRESSDLYTAVRAGITSGIRNSLRFLPTGVSLSEQTESSLAESAITTGECLFVCLSTGMLLFFRPPAGDWVLYWPSLYGSDASLYMQVTPANTNLEYLVDKMAIFKLYDLFTTDSGIATGYADTPVSGSRINMQSDGFVSFFWTPAAAETLELSIRRTNDDNRWIVRCDQAAGTIKLVERNGGVETDRDDDPITWTPGTQYRVQVRAITQSIRVYVNAAVELNYSFASFNQTATGVMVSGFTSGSKLSAYPRNLPASALAEIARYIP